MAESQTPDLQTPTTLAQRMGTHWVDDVQRYQKAPTLVPIELPSVPLANAIWGATGRDVQGSIYFGIACEGPGVPSATLCQLSTGDLRASVAGNAVEQLKAWGIQQPNLSQMKIHTKPVQASDGMVYFASMDERGERADGSRLPDWGSHLWRIDPVTMHWEHLAAIPEGIIATGCTGRYVYALAYFDHILYQYDTVEGTIARRTIGSVGGHISRNILVDANEHVYVPRITVDAVPEEGTDTETQPGYLVRLVEFDTRLAEITSHPLPHYPVTPDFDSHGIVGFSALADGGLVFTTSTGYLYRLTPGVAGENDLPIAADLNQPPDPPAPDTRQNGTASQLRLLGTVLPQGESYTACLFCPDGESLLCGLGRRRRVSDYTAFTYNLQSNQARLVPVGPETADALSKPKLLLYGCNTLDDQGNGYAVGRWRDEPGFRPIAFRVEWPEPVDD